MTHSQTDSTTASLTDWEINIINNIITLSFTSMESWICIYRPIINYSIISRMHIQRNRSITEHTGCSLNIVFFLKVLWFFWTLPVVLQRWCSTCLVCVHKLRPRENRVQNILNNSEKTQYLMNTLYILREAVNFVNLWRTVCII